MSKKVRKVEPKEKFDEFFLENTVYLTHIPESYKNRIPYTPPDEKNLLAFIPGTIREMHVKVGDIVNKGDLLMILEAMKMNNEVKSPVDGKVKAIHIKEGNMVRKNQSILELE